MTSVSIIDMAVINEFKKDHRIIDLVTKCGDKSVGFLSLNSEMHYNGIGGLQLEITPTNSTISENNNENKRLLGVIYGIGMNVNNILGAGIFTTPGIVWKNVKSPYIVLGLWLIGGIVSLFGSLIYTEYGAIHKDSGGETIYLATAYPKPYLMFSYLFSFMFIFVIRPGIICAVLQSAAQYTWYLFNDVPFAESSNCNLTEINRFNPNWIIKLTAIGLLFLITGYHLLSNKWANKINHTLAIIKTILLVVIAFGGISRYKNTNNWTTPPEGEMFKFTSYSIAIISVLFSYNGWNNLNYSLDEFRNPEERLKKSNIYSVGIVTFLYLMVNIAFITAVPLERINNDIINETIAVDFFNIIFEGNTTGMKILSFCVVLSAIGTAASSIWSGSRVIVTAAKSNFFPIFSPQLKSLNNKFNTPVTALLAQLGWCTLIMLVVGSTALIDNFILYTSVAMFCSWIFYVITSLGLVILRRTSSTDLAYPFKVPLPIIYLFILFGFITLLLSFWGIDSNCPKLNLLFIIISFIFLIIGFLLWFGLFYWRHLEEQRKEDRISEINEQVEIRLAAISESQNNRRTRTL
ncbi:16362_t:CDS:2 [Funneliformis geosporum]|uniref:17536_t:CDS:1 n=1 Tax=Funneliformis geosporum TaxID=1117311 RepID=A0A9W4WX49_9GLOM|nr:17536_t:CDS:2 [Funneliformis geosporum]CAI2185924.1 16362_t:CDS:2 [Funneliformis geosporum]